MLKAIVLVCTTFTLLASSVFAQGNTLDYHLLWETGTGDPSSIEWIEDSEIRVRTTKSIDVLDVTLEMRSELIAVFNIYDGVTLGYESQYLTQVFQGEIWAWDASTEELRVFEDIGTTSALARRPQYNQLVVSIPNFINQQERLELWDIASGEVLATFPEITNEVSTLSWRPDGQKLAVGTSDGGTIVYSVNQASVTIDQHLYSGPVDSLSWRVDNNLLAISTFDDPFFVLWDTTTYQAISSASPEGFRGQLEWNNTGQYLAGRLEDGAISIWDYENNNWFSIDYDISNVADYAWGNNSLAVLLRDGNVDVWDAESQQRLAFNFIYTGEIAGFSTSPQTHRTAVVYQPSNTIHILDSTTRTEQYSLTPVSPVAPSDFADIAWSANGQTLAVGYNDYVEIWTLGESTETPIVIEYDGRMPYLAWNPIQNNQLSISWGNDDDRSLLLVDTTTGSIEERIPIEGLGEITWRPDGEQLALYRYVSPSDQEGNTSNVQILDAQTYEVVQNLSFAEMTPTAKFSWLPDSTGLFGIECYRGIEGCGFWSWDVNSEIIEHTIPEFLEFPLGVVSFAFDPDGRYIAIGDIAKPEVHIFSRDTLELLVTLDEFDAPSISIEWAHDGNLYISDGILRAFEVVQ